MWSWGPAFNLYTKQEPPGSTLFFLYTCKVSYARDLQFRVHHVRFLLCLPQPVLPHLSPGPGEHDPAPPLPGIAPTLPILAVLSRHRLRERNQLCLALRWASHTRTLNPGARGARVRCFSWVSGSRLFGYCVASPPQGRNSRLRRCLSWYAQLSRSHGDPGKDIRDRKGDRSDAEEQG